MTDWPAPQRNPDQRNPDQRNPDVESGVWRPAYPPITNPPTRSTLVNKKHVIGYAATALVALFLGTAAGSGGGAAGPSPTGAAPTVSVAGPTVSVAGPATTVPGTTATVAGPTVTVSVPGPATTVTAQPPAPAVAMAGDGTYEVGVDVQPGTYVSATPASGNCYWARLRGGDGLDSIIANGNSKGQVVVTISQSDKFFESSRCSGWTKR